MLPSEQEVVTSYQKSVTSPDCIKKLQTSQKDNPLEQSSGGLLLVCGNWESKRSVRQKPRRAGFCNEGGLNRTTGEGDSPNMTYFMSDEGRLPLRTTGSKKRAPF